MTDAEKVKLYELFLKNLAKSCEGPEPECPINRDDEGTMIFCGNTDDAYEAGERYGEDMQLYDLATSAHLLLKETGVIQATSDNEESDCG